MLVFSLQAEQQFNPRRHIERVLGRLGEGDVTVACWAPGGFVVHPPGRNLFPLSR